MTVLMCETTLRVPRAEAWKILTEAEHIVNWNFASDDWESPRATNDLRVGGSFSFAMAAKDGSAGFDFGGVYTKVSPGEGYEYTIGDGRKVVVELSDTPEGTHIVEHFDAETVNSDELQVAGWSAILDNLRVYAERLFPSGAAN